MSVRLSILTAILICALAAAFPLQRYVAARETQTSAVTVGDTAFYRGIAGRVAAGEGYYSAAAKAHRAGQYPLKPFYAVRLPTLAKASAALGERTMFYLAWAALLAILVVWHRALNQRHPAERIAALGILALTGASAMIPKSWLPLQDIPSALALHEFWAGLLLALALGFTATRSWILPLAIGMVAVSVRELALPFLFVLLAQALSAREWRQASAMVLGLCVCLAGLLLHRAAVNVQVLPSDLASQGWLGLRGPAGPVSDLIALSWLQLLWRPLACLLAFLPMAGWYQLGGKTGWVAGLWFAGIGAALALFARNDNFYWAQMLLPAYFAGLAFVPSFLGALGLSARRGAKGKAL